MEKETLELTEPSGVFVFTSIRDVVNQTLHNSIFENTIAENLSGISSGFKKLDHLTGGFHPAEFTLVGVRPSMGKTAFLLSLLFNIAVTGKTKTAVFSSERSSKKLVQRLIESETGMSLEKLRQAKLKDSDKEHLHALIGSIANAGILFDDSQDLSVYDVIERCRAMVNEQKVEIIMVDYLESFLKHIFESDERKIMLDRVTEAMQQLAIELNVPVILFSKVEKTGTISTGKLHLTLEDVPAVIRETADSIILIDRPYVDQVSKDEKCKHGCAELIVAKNPQLKETASISVRFLDSIDKFVDFE
ncbi:MAG: AAA family ATPase [Bacteroidetes bacterium]|nr:AAA family ATPase [Bacteroidota bacterium]